MEFKFRAVDDRPPPFPSPPSSCFNHSDQPLPMAGQAISPMLHVPSGFRMGDLGTNSDLTRNPSDVREHIVRGLEQEWLSEEMILEEIAWRRELEAVVRQEIVFLEREMAMRRAAMGAMSFEDGFPAAMHFAFAPFPYSSRSAAFDPFSMALPLENIAAVFKPPSEPNKDKLIVLAKPEPNLSRAKRKALEPPTLDSNEIYPFVLKKKPKEELSCALCQVSATGEKDLNNHLQGKKHKRKEAALRNQKMGKNPSNASCPKKTGDPSKPKETNSAANSNLEEGKSIKQIGSQNVSDKKKEDAENVKPKNMLLMQKDQNARELNKSRSEMVQKTGRSVDHKATKRTKTGKKFKYWCGMCQVGSLSSRVMEQHKKGKKHRGKLLGYETYRCEEATLKTQPSQAIPVKPEDPDAVEQADVKTTDNMENTEAADEKPEDKDVANQANDKITEDMSNVHENLKDIDVANQVNEETTNGTKNTEAIHEKPEDKDVANQTNEKTTEDMEYAKAIHEKPEDRGVANQTSERATVDLTNAKAVPENPAGTDVANQENGRVQTTWQIQGLFMKSQ